MSQKQALLPFGHPIISGMLCHQGPRMRRAGGTVDVAASLQEGLKTKTSPYGLYRIRRDILRVCLETTGVD